MNGGWSPTCSVTSVPTGDTLAVVAPYCDTTFNYVGAADYVSVRSSVTDGRRSTPEGADNISGLGWVHWLRWDCRVGSRGTRPSER